MSDVVALARRVGQIEVSPQFSNYSKVLIHVDNETVIEVGNDTGRTLEFTCPFATQQMAESILSSLTGFQYQPYKVTDALLDPAAEIGDAANTRGSYGGIYSRNTKFSEMMAADISAPHDEEINHEYQFESPQERSFNRQINDVKASLIIANDRIDASVSKTGGEESSFGWSLQADGHRWFSGNKEVMSVTASGLTVKGRVEASEGKIGNFNISATAIWNNLSEFGGTQSSGVYVGTNGIQLGQGVKMWPSGQAQFTNVSANNMTLTGTLNIGGTAITANALRSGAQSAYSNGSRWSTGSGYGYNYNNATKTSGGSYPSFFRASTLRGGNVQADTNIILGSNKFACSRVTIGGSTYSLVTWSAY